MPHTSRHTARIRALYETIDEATKERGRTWYIQEHKEAARLAFDSGHSLRAVSACLAVLSPRCQWPRVKQSCRELLAGEMPAGLFGHNLAKARQILKTGNTISSTPIARRKPGRSDRTSGARTTRSP